MISQHFYLPDYDWEIYSFYAINEYPVDDIIGTLEDCNCSSSDYNKIYTFINQAGYNTGLTYTNNIEGVSIMVIGPTTSADEFQNTFDHEKGHLVSHIASALDIDPYSEEYQYLSGEIGQKLFKKAHIFLCERCRKYLLF